LHSPSGQGVSERQVSSQNPEAKLCSPARLLVMAPFQEEWQGCGTNLVDGFCCVVVSGSNPKSGSGLGGLPSSTTQ
jgi:hypothetical protein